MDDLYHDRRYLIPFRSTLLPQIFCDTVVIGAGVAGLRAAIEASRDGGEVIILGKSEMSLTNTAWAQGGVAAVLGTSDEFEAHVLDTLNAGAGLCDRHAVDTIVRDGADRVHELIAWGMRFDRDASGELSVAREGGHTASRIYHTDGDGTGREFQRLLGARAAACESVRVFGGCFALDLITPPGESGGPCLGVITHHAKYGLQVIWAKSTILASGGAGQIYRETSNPRPSTGDGLAMAYRAGATVNDMAFMQFHPTTLYLAGANRVLISEAVRGEGARLVDHNGSPFMDGEHPMADLAPRDIVARSIVRHIAREGGTHVWLDCRGLDDFAGRFPGIDATLKRFEIDASTDLVPVHPAAHYMIGGVRATVDGVTDVPNLFAIGEAASNGLHGANRLASNSLLEGLVTGARAGAIAAEANGSARSGGSTRIVSEIPPSQHGELDLHDVRSSLRSAMWRNVGIERTESRLADACDMFDFWGRYTLDKVFDDPAGWETQNMLLVAALVARSALWRRETRGCHWRADSPEHDDSFRVHDGWHRDSDNPDLTPVVAEAAL